MPEISRFLGIIITMYWEREARHHLPHFNAKYNEYSCVFSLPELNILEGALPYRAMSHVIEWAKEHINELNDNWNLVENNKPVKKIQPLE
jgi:hypothetical protein